MSKSDEQTGTTRTLVGTTTKKLDQYIMDRQPEDKVIFYKDPATAGLRLRVTPKGGKFWVYGYSIKTAYVDDAVTNAIEAHNADELIDKLKFKFIPRSISLGSFDKDGMTVAKARAEVETLKGLIKQGIDPAKDRKNTEHKEQVKIAEQAARMTVQAVFNEWMDEEISSRKDGGAEVRRMMEKDVLPVIGLLPMADVKKAHIAKINSTVKKRGERIGRVVFDLCRQMINFAMHKDYIEVDITTSIDRKRVGNTGKRRERTLSDDEVRELFRLLPESGLVGANLLAIPLQLSTACRIGELLSAKWADVDLDAREWFIPDSKNGRPHTVHLSDFTLRHLHQLHELTGGGEWLYPASRNDSHINEKSVTKQVADRQRVDASQIIKGRSVKNATALVLPGGKWTPHDLRRTASTLMGELDISPDVIDRCQNHIEQNKIRETYQRYNYRPQMIQAWDKLGERLELLTNPAADNVAILKQKTA